MKFQTAARNANGAWVWKRSEVIPQLRSRIPKRADSIAVLVLLLITSVMWLPRRAAPIDLRVDAGVYYVLGTSLAKGDGYRLLNEPGNIPAVQYPPFVPGIIAVDQLLLGTSDVLVNGRSLKRLWFAFFLSFILLTYYYLRLSLHVYWAFAGALMCALNVQPLFYSNQCTAEIPFALISLMFVVVDRNVHRFQTPAAILAISAFFCRTIGIALFAAWIVDAFRKGQLRNAVLRSSLAAACVLSWSIYIGFVEQSPEYRNPAYSYQRAAYMLYNVSYARNVIYKDPFRPELGKASFVDRVRRFAENARAIPQGLGEAVSTYRLYWDKIPATLNRQIGLNLFPSNIGSALTFVTGSLIIFGTVVLLRKQEGLVALYIFFTMFLACCAPWQQIARYMLPIVPLLLRAFFEALRSIRSWFAAFSPAWPKRLADGSIAAGLAVILGQQILTCVVAFRYSGFETYRTSRGKVIQFPELLYQDEDAALGQAADWIRDRARPDDVLAAAMPQWVYLKTGLKTVMPPLENDPRRADSLLDSVPVRYLIVENKSRMGNSVLRYMSSVVRAFPREWPMVYINREGTIRVFEHGSSGLSK